MNSLRAAKMRRGKILNAPYGRGAFYTLVACNKTAMLNVFIAFLGPILLHTVIDTSKPNGDTLARQRARGSPTCPQITRGVLVLKTTDRYLITSLVTASFSAELI